MEIERSQLRVSSEPVQVGFNEMMLKDFVDQLEKIMSGFEVGYLPKLRIAFTTSEESYGIEMEISHWRPETDDEMKRRVFRISKQEVVNERRERALLKTLQEKYGQ